jgi:hypothetical protein
VPPGAGGLVRGDDRRDVGDALSARRVPADRRAGGLPPGAGGLVRPDDRRDGGGAVPARHLHGIHRRLRLHARVARLLRPTGGSDEPARLRVLDDGRRDDLHDDGGADPRPGTGRCGPDDDGVSLRADGDPCPAGTWSETGTVPAGGMCIPARPGTYVARRARPLRSTASRGPSATPSAWTACTPAPAGTYVPVAGPHSRCRARAATQPGATTCDEVDSRRRRVLDDADGRAAGGLTRWLVLLAGGVLGLGAGLLVLERRRPGSVTALLGGSARPRRAERAETLPDAARRERPAHAGRWRDA